MNRTAIPILGVVALSLAACSSTGAPSRARAQQMVENQDVRNEAVTVKRTAAGSPREVWRALRAVYDELELEVTASDPVNRVLAARQNRMRRLGGERNSHWVDCGDDVTGPVADKSFITFDVVTVLTEGTASTTDLGIRVQARGMRRDGASGELICSSEGALEREITDRVNMRLVAG